MSDIRNSRVLSFKGANRNAQELRRKRQEQSVELRKAARDDQLQKRRAYTTVDDDEAPLSPPSVTAPDGFNEMPKLPTVDEILEALNSKERNTQLLGARAARKTLSRETNPPIDSMIQSGCVPLLVKMLDYDDCPDLQFEAAWALTNVASGTSAQTAIVIENNAIPPLVRLCNSSNLNLRDQSLWALGNIAGDGAQERDLVLSHGILVPLLKNMEAELNNENAMAGSASSILKTAIWTLSNLCRNKNPTVDFKTIQIALPMIAKILYCSDKDVLTDACWALSYLTDGPDERIEAVQEVGVLTTLIPLLGHHIVHIQTPALRAVGNMVTGNNEQTQRVLEAGALPMLYTLLNSPRSAIVKEAAWTACNILAGTEKQRDMFIEANLLPSLIKVLSHSESRCQREAAYSITNLIIEGTISQIQHLAEANALKPYLKLLTAPDPKTVLVVLDGLTHLLQQAENMGHVEQFSSFLEENGFLDILEGLQRHENEAVYKKALHIVDKYFSADEDDDQNLAPQQTDDEFRFAAANGHINF